MITFTKNGETKIVSPDSSLVEKLEADGWIIFSEPKEETLKKEVKGGKARTTNSK